MDWKYINIYKNDIELMIYKNSKEVIIYKYEKNMLYNNWGKIWKF